MGQKVEKDISPLSKVAEWVEKNEKMDINHVKREKNTCRENNEHK